MTLTRLITFFIILSLPILAKDKSNRPSSSSAGPAEGGAASTYIDVGPGTAVDGYRAPPGAVGAIVSYGNQEPVWVFPNGAQSKPTQRTQLVHKTDDIPEVPFSKKNKGRIINVDDRYETFKRELSNEPNPVVFLEFYSQSCPACRQLEKFIESDLIYANQGKISFYRVLQEDSGSAISTREQYRDTVEKGYPAVFLLAADKDGDWAIVDEDSGLPRQLSGKRFNDVATHFAVRFPRRRLSTSGNADNSEEIILLPPKEE